MKVNARIHESRISLVQNGQKVSVKVDAFPGEIFNGVVDMVASVPSSTGGFSRDFKEYDAAVKIVDDAEKVNKLRPGLTASVEILVERRADVMQVPVQSVVTVGNRQFVFVAKDRHVTTVEIKVGKSNERMLEIIPATDAKKTDAGLKVGDEVVMNPRSHFKKEIDALESEVAKEQAALRAKVAEASPTQSAAPAVKPDRPATGPGTNGPGAGASGPGTPGAGGPPAGGSRPDPAVRFKELDKDGDGKLTKEEVADDRMAARFDSMDSNGDGVVTLDEMKAASARFRAGGGAGGEPRPPAN